MTGRGGGTGGTRPARSKQTPPGRHRAPADTIAAVAAVELSGVSRRFGRTEALASTNLRIEAGEIVTVLGPSGSGKTRLLRIVGGLVAPSAGEVVVDGMTPARGPGGQAHRVRAPAPGVAAVAHRRGQRPAAPADQPPGRRTRRRRQPGRLLEQVGLAEFLGAYPHELSGGMQQRVALAQALALGAPLLLMDEPFAALDEMTRTDMRHLVTGLCEPLGTTILFVTHSIAEAVFLSERVAVLSSRPGTLVGVESVDLVRPRRADARGRPGVLRPRTAAAGAPPRGDGAIGARRGGRRRRRAGRLRAGLGAGRAGARRAAVRAAGAVEIGRNSGAARVLPAGDAGDGPAHGGRAGDRPRRGHRRRRRARRRRGSSSTPCSRC